MASVEYRRLIACVLFMVLGSFSIESKAKCLSRTTTSPDGKEQTNTIVVPESHSKDFEAAGYREAQCASIDREAYRAHVCAPKFFGNTGVQRQLEIQLGFSFAQLCASAREDAGLPELSPKDEFPNQPINARPRSQTPIAPKDKDDPQAPPISRLLGGN